MYGCATASYQIEGAYDENGKGLSVWDDYLKDKDNGEIACDSYHLWRDDIKLLKQYGCDTYRFSIAWARVKPLGGKDDPVNEAGVKYYSDLIDALLENDITPFVTIFHWDVPLALQQRYAGFLEPDRIVPDFVAYARLCFERFGDRVHHWITINEPHIFTMMSSSSYLANSWTQKRDHARTVTGWIPWMTFADPIYLGRFPSSVIEFLGEHTPEFTAEQWEAILGSSDFFGWNHYGTQQATGKRLGETDNPRLFSFGSIERVFERDGKSLGNMGEAGHPVDVPWGFRKLTRYIHKRYTAPHKIPIIITECGFTPKAEDTMSFDDRIKDTQRQDYYAGYLKEMMEAVKDDGIDVAGFMAWSLLDNLEWLYGYKKRFGVTIVDWQDGCRRYPKDSAMLLRDIFAYAIARST
ncbi:hypothetical protein Q5752_007126 [Cryptotrichosporon argae]